MSIAVGFVVDDAIVMLENISRHIEEGDEAATHAALKGFAGDRLHHPVDQHVADRGLIPLLLMGGIIGRLFREFAITLAMTHRWCSIFVSLTLTPMMASRFLKEPITPPGTANSMSGCERAFDRHLARL